MGHAWKQNIGLIFLFIYSFGFFFGGRGDVNFCCAVGFSLIRHAYDILHIIKILSEKIIFSLEEI